MKADAEFLLEIDRKMREFENRIDIIEKKLGLRKW